MKKTLKSHRRNADILPFVRMILTFSPRQLEGETRTCKFLQQTLRGADISYAEHAYTVKIPNVSKTTLSVDGHPEHAEGCSMIGGTIRDKSSIISSLTPMNLPDLSNINFNPKCMGISHATYYFKPAISVSLAVLKKVLQARHVTATVHVKKQKHIATDLLVGNVTNPEVVCFAHYDSIKMGAIDNASGVSVMMAAIRSNRDLLEKNLFVFAANEELSYDKPIYWGHGFRIFEKHHKQTLERSKRIIVIDCVGNGPTQVINDVSLMRLGFPIKALDRHSKKILCLTADFEHLMSVYHSDLDDGRGLSEKHLQSARKTLIALVRRE